MAKAKALKCGSFTDVNRLLAEIAEHKRDMDAKQAALDGEQAKLRVSYEEPIGVLKKEVTRREKAMEGFCELHKEEMEALEGRRSRKLPNGVVRFHKTPNALATLKGRTWKAFTESLMAAAKWPKIVKLIQAAAGLFYPLLRIKVEPDKDAIKKAIDDGVLSAERAENLGVEVTSNDEFKYEVATSDLANTVPIDGERGRKAAG